MGMASIASQVMGGGFSPGQITALQGTVSSGISAAGSTRATATALTNAVNLVGTATALQGVSLPAVGNGDTVQVYNDATGVTIVVYPDSGSNRINQLSAGNGMQLANNTNCIFQKVSATRWLANLSA